MNELRQVVEAATVIWLDKKLQATGEVKGSNLSVKVFTAFATVGNMIG